MCGIAGIVRFNKDKTEDRHILKRMCESLAHRGPDEESFDSREGIGLGVRRLSIIDVSGGHQPYFNNELDQWLYVDLKSYLCDNILVKVDRMSMACSLEAGLVPSPRRKAPDPIELPIL